MSSASLTVRVASSWPLGEHASTVQRQGGRTGVDCESGLARRHGLDHVAVDRDRDGDCRPVGDIQPPPGSRGRRGGRCRRRPAAGRRRDRHDGRQSDPAEHSACPPSASRQRSCGRPDRRQPRGDSRQPLPGGGLDLGHPKVGEGIEPEQLQATQRPCAWRRPTRCLLRGHLHRGDGLIGPEVASGHLGAVASPGVPRRCQGGKACRCGARGAAGGSRTKRSGGTSGRSNRTGSRLRQTVQTDHRGRKKRQNLPLTSTSPQRPMPTPDEVMATRAHRLGLVGPAAGCLDRLGRPSALPAGQPRRPSPP